MLELEEFLTMTWFVQLFYFTDKESEAWAGEGICSG
jgi:hypothetical protein